MSTNPLIPTAALEGLMKKVFEDASAPPGLFWEAFLNANIYVPLAKADERGIGKEVAYSPTEGIPILLGVDGDGKSVIWIFTSTDVMADYTEQDLNYHFIPAREFMKRVQGNQKDVVLVGPNCITLRLDPGFVGSLANGVVPESPLEKQPHKPKQMELIVGKAIEPEALVERFLPLFSSMPNVLEARFIQIEDENGSRLLLGLRLEKENRDQLKIVAERLAQAAEGVLDKGKTMDITLLEGSLKGAFDKWGIVFFKK